MHHKLASPPRQGRTQSSCYGYEDSDGRADTYLKDCLGADGLVHFLSWLERQRVTGHGTEEFTEIVRRLMVPNYEEARQYWGRAVDDGFIREPAVFSRYHQESLLLVIEKYGTDEAADEIT